MSVHKSLKLKNTLVRARNVWTRLERIQKLEEDGKFTLKRVRTLGSPKTDSSFGLIGYTAPRNWLHSRTADMMP